MTKCIELSFTQEDVNGELRQFFKNLLEKKALNSIMVPLRQPQGLVMQTLISNPDQLENVDPFAPVIPVNSAKLASSITATSTGKKVGLVMRSCEVRAFVELIKLNQAGLEEALIIGIDCYGRFENKDYKKFTATGGTTASFLAKAKAEQSFEGDVSVCGACSICEFPAVDIADLRLGLLGAANGKIIVESTSDKGLQALTEAGHNPPDTPAARETAIQKLAATRLAKRDEAFTAYRETNDSFEALENALADCVNCYNCRVACPVCYCKECVFVTDTFRHKSEQLIGWANQRGSLKLPTDTLFYHLVRMSHIATMCTGCGQCTSACPNEIDLMPIFRTAAEKAQNRFDYLAGRSIDEPQPLSVFEFDEMIEVTGQEK